MCYTRCYLEYSQIMPLVPCGGADTTGLRRSEEMPVGVDRQVRKDIGVPLE